MPPQLLNKVACGLIRLYQQTLSGRIGRVCIYDVSCSRYALEVLGREHVPFWEALRLVWRRLRSCRVAEIVRHADRRWSLINGLGQTLHESTISSATREQLECSLARLDPAQNDPQ